MLVLAVPTFADLIAPIDVEAFRSEYFGKRPLHITREGRSRLDILNWRRFNETLAITPYWNEDSLRLYFKSRPALRDTYCDPPEAGRKAIANPARVKALISLGASLVANHIHRVCPEVAAVVNMLETEFAARVFANVYCSFKDVQAFQTHYDLHDVFAFQAEGEKTWRIYEGRADAPVNPLPPGDETEQWLLQTRGSLLFEAHMKPGDLLYLPRGQYHDALTGSQASLHVTFGVLPATGLALFKLLEEAAAEQSEFRAYLADARNEAELRRQLERLCDRIREIALSRAFAFDVLSHQRGRRSPLAEYDLPAQRRSIWYSPAKKAKVVRRDDGYFLTFDGGELAVGTLHATVEWMLRQRQFSREVVDAQQPGVESTELSALLDQLLRAGVLVETQIR